MTHLLPVETVTAVPRDPRPLRAVLYAVAVGAVLSVVWSFEFVDGTIGDNVANTLLGHDAKETAITGAWAGIVFAAVSGLAGTFTACNVAVFGSLPTLLTSGPARRSRLRSLLVALGWLTAGAATVSGIYGAVGVAVGERMPQLSSATVGDGVPVRLVQASVVFGVLGLCFVYLGLAGAGLAPDPIRRLERRFAPARLVVLGVLVGAFLIGRPFPLFRKMFEQAAENGNVLYGAATFVLQSVGNIAVVAVLFLALAGLTRGRAQAWMARRATTLAAGAFVALGTFSVLYWVVRVPARFGYGWFPTVPWS